MASKNIFRSFDFEIGKASISFSLWAIGRSLYLGLLWQMMLLKQLANEDTKHKWLKKPSAFSDMNDQFYQEFNPASEFLRSSGVASVMQRSGELHHLAEFLTNLSAWFDIDRPSTETDYEKLEEQSRSLVVDAEWLHLFALSEMRRDGTFDKRQMARVLGETQANPFGKFTGGRVETKAKGFWDFLVFSIGEPVNWAVLQADQSLNCTERTIKQRAHDWRCSIEEWFDEGGLQKYVQSRDPAQGYLNLAEFAQLVQEHLLDFTEERDPAPLTQRIERHNRLVTLTKWLEMLGRAEASEFSTVNVIDVTGRPAQDKSPEKDSGYQTVCDALKGNGLKIFKFLHGRKHKTDYRTLQEQVWGKEISEDGISRAIERLADSLNKMAPISFIVTNEKASRRVGLESVRPSREDK